jgi:hypothetical protein
LCAGDKIEKNEMGEACSTRTYGEERGVFRVFWGNPGGKIPLGRSRRRWEDNIKMDLQDWVELAQDRDRLPALLNVVMTFGFHKMRGIS